VSPVLWSSVKNLFWLVSESWSRREGDALTFGRAAGIWRSLGCRECSGATSSSIMYFSDSGISGISSNTRSSSLVTRHKGEGLLQSKRATGCVLATTRALLLMMRDMALVVGATGPASSR
jgi:hypothetical protein